MQKGQDTIDINILELMSQRIDPDNLGRIAGDYGPDSSASINTVLFDGDQIIIPRKPNIISVLGEVLNPVSFEFKEGISLREAIDFAGGYQEFAAKSQVYVIKANGLVVKRNRNVFKGVDRTLEAGDTIIVPRRIVSTTEGIDLLVPLTGILSNLAFSAAALENLSEN